MKQNIKLGIKFLNKTQEKNGGFFSLSSPDPENFSKTRETYQTVFPSCLILSCLNQLESSPEAKVVKTKLVNFLLTQKSKYWSYNYWQRKSPETQTKPYPDDLDDTFCALSALSQYKKELIDGAAMAKIVNLLTAVETEEGGPYKTWLVTNDADEIWRDVDLAVNSNVAYFLSIHEVNLPNIVELVERAVVQQKFSSPYYPSSYPVLYFIGRFYRGEKQQQITDFLIRNRKKDRTWGNPLNTALAVSAFLNLGGETREVEKSIEYLEKKQEKNGAWEATAFCLDPNIKKTKHYAGSQAYTTAFCLEALAKFNIAIGHNVSKKATIDTNEIKIHNAVVEQVENRFRSLDLDLKQQAQKFLKKILNSKHKQEIILLPYYYKLALGPNGKTLSNNLITRLGKANLFGWIAYTIYDDFLDNEGNIKQLSLANLALREVSTIFYEILPKTNFRQFFHKILDQIDSANTWEVSHCRLNYQTITSSEFFTLPDYQDQSRLAKRSLGHALGPIAMMFALGHNEKSESVSKLTNFFTHYLAARQLNDEAHDWEDDLTRNHFNAIAVMLLKESKKKGLFLNNLKDDVIQLQQIFWSNGMVINVSQQIFDQLTKAEQVLGEINEINEKKLLLDLLEPVRQSATKALAEREESIKFIKSYSS